jgi:tetratricopeptide (TPR) repeat protein
MSKHNTLLFLVLLYILAAGHCCAQSNIASKESQIRKNMMANPQLVKTLVKEVLDGKEKLPDSTSANMYIYYGFANNLLNKPDSAIYYYKKALPFAENDPKMKAKAFLNFGVSYRKLTQYENSLKYLRQSEALNSHINYRTGLAMVYGEIASVYNQQVKHEKSVEYLLKAIDIIKESNKPANLNPLKQRLAGTYMATKNYVFAADIYAEVLGYFKTADQKNYFVTLVNYGQCLYFLKRYTQAQKVLNEAMPGLKNFNDSESTGMALSWLGAIAFKEKNIVEAEAYYDKALNILYQKKSYSTPTILLQYLTNLNENSKYEKASKVIAYSEKLLKAIPVTMQIMANIENQKAISFKGSDAKDKSIASLQKSIELKNYTDIKDNEAMLHKLQAQYQNELQREKNVSLARKNKLLALKVKSETQIKIILFGLCTVALCIIVAGYLLYRFKRKLQKEKLKNITIKNEFIAQQYDNEQENNRKLKKSLLEKQTDLVSGAMRLATIQENINDMLTVVKQKEGIDDVDFLAKKLETLIKQEDYWEAFEKKFSEAHPDFKAHMAEVYPALNKTDLFFASLLKLRLPYKEIGKLMVISPESVVKRKYRLKKKMVIEDEEEFDKVLGSL